ncbi:radical SAM protein [Metallosphaera hakonensis]|uniref:Radical SAM protein n=1 Tax=Metallosphaera hakonensis JCM 8857 = DSM 7519 TaxID=1293036 RepID=A0A2U9IVU0_9CREN|nr:radical SAM protein [Metallosphaera hakonensis]AWS00115.1 radical SAM protein [Metallosphaera hakonensis JCM 8857 = DSM 7519]
MTLRINEIKTVSSPDWVRLSFGADMVLGFSPGKFLKGALNTTINLLQYYPDGCKANCIYCGQAREVSQGPECKTLIRVEWPLRQLNAVLERIKERQGDPNYGLQRICVGQLAHPRASPDAIEITRRIRENGIELQISELVTATYTRKEDMRKMKEAGGNMIDVAIDAASKRVFDAVRGKPVRSMHNWDRYVEAIDDAVEVFGKKNAGIHLIIGLGETEQEAVNLMLYAHSRGAKISLFAFYPEETTPMENRKPVPVHVYRRMQLSRWLIENDLVKADDFRFDESGQLVDIELKSDISLNELSGAFMTSGCPGCNRPYSNERPGDRLRNIPWYPTEKQTISALKTSRLPLAKRFIN